MWRFDAVSWLTIYLLFLYGVPSRLVVGPLGSAGAISMLIGLTSLGLWLLARAGASRSYMAPPDPLRVALALFLLSVGVSYALAMARPISRDEVSPGDVALLSLLSWTGTLLLARDGVPNRQRLDDLVWRTTIAGGLLAFLGVVQFLTKQPWVDLISLPGLTATQDTATFFRDGRIRPFGTAIHPLEYGTILSLLLPLTLHVAFHHRHRNVILRWLPALLVGGLVAISSSRAAYLSGILGVLVCMLGWTARQRRIVIGLAIGGVLTLMVIIPRLVTSILNLFMGVSDDPSIASRTDSFTVAWRFLEQDPLFGRGLGTFLPKYRIFDNQYLQLLVCVGVIGTTLFVAFLAVALTQMWRASRTSSNALIKDLAISLAGSIFSGALSLAFFDAFAFPMTMGSLFLVLGMSGALSRIIQLEGPVLLLPTEEGRKHPRRAFRRRVTSTR